MSLDLSSGKYRCLHQRNARTLPARRASCLRVLAHASRNLQASASVLRVSGDDVSLSGLSAASGVSVDVPDMDTGSNPFQEQRESFMQLLELKELSERLLTNLREIEEMDQPALGHGPKVPLAPEKSRGSKKPVLEAATSALEPISRPGKLSHPSQSAATNPNSHHQLGSKKLDHCITSLQLCKQRLDCLLLDASLDAPPGKQQQQQQQQQQSGESWTGDEAVTSWSPTHGIQLSQKEQPHRDSKEDLPTNSPLFPLAREIQLASTSSAWTSIKRRRRASRSSDVPAATNRASIDGTDKPSATKGHVKESKNELEPEKVVSARKIPAMTPREEKALALLVQDRLRLVEIRDTAATALRRNPTQQEWAKAAGIEEGLASGQAAKSAFIQSNRWLVKKMVNHYTKQAPKADLIAAGMQGLELGIEKFDASKGFRMGTYVHWWIRQALTRLVTEQSRTIRLPNHIYPQVMKMRVAYYSLMRKHDSEPTAEEIAAAMGVSTAQVQQLQLMGREVLSLDVPVADKEDASTMVDALEDCSAPGKAALEQEVVMQAVEDIISGLKPRDALILKMRFGLDVGMPSSLSVVADRVGVTRERVRQIEARVMAQLKRGGARSKSLELLKASNELRVENLPPKLSSTSRSK